ncbi:hypothetical protein O181_008590 [Austropuccinia psidii MF-1]|uniref:Uncharacterized protein n=1 Tax=Austropuccinia psidii MF-1 TaxID=1389203 RepID=A0A9Q3BPN0_9BASI|nr:hypothetical protein [Austropuccinia psidii MF-1]
MEGYGSSSLAPPTSQRAILMEHGKQEVQPSITLGKNWSKFPEYNSQKIPFKSLIIITKGWNPNRQLKLLEERETRIRESQATIQAIEEQLNQKEPTLIP